MSFSKGFGGNTNPCKHFIEHKGGDGFFQRWDKEEKKNVKVDMSQFIVIDESLFTITGYSERLNTGFYSNEVRRLDEELNVRYSANKKQNTLIVGTYTDIKEKIKSEGAKYTQSVYILIPESNLGIESDAWVLANVKFSGSSLNAWIEFRKEKLKMFQTHIVGVVRHVHKDKKGKPNAEYPEGKVITQWEEPVFGITDEISTNLFEIAKEEDIELQKYLEVYLAKGADSSMDQSPIHAAEDEVQEFRDGEETVTKKEEAPKEKPKEEAPPFDTDDDDTKDWADYKPKSEKYPTLGKCSVDQLNEMKEVMENGNFTGALAYKLVIRGLAEKKKAAKKNPFGNDESPI
jgi:hypothetical protein